MAWELLPTDYTDAIWSGLKKYEKVDNADGTVSFKDVTEYSSKEKSFFGSREANKMNEALNTIMSMVEQGTDLYEAFQIYFDEQKVLFEEKADDVVDEFDTYTDVKKVEYGEKIEDFEHTQEVYFDEWFETIRGQLDEDAAAKLQEQINKITYIYVDGEILFLPDTSGSVSGETLVLYGNADDPQEG